MSSSLSSYSFLFFISSFFILLCLLLSFPFTGHATPACMTTLEGMFFYFLISFDFLFLNVRLFLSFVSRIPCLSLWILFLFAHKIVLKSLRTFLLFNFDSCLHTVVQQRSSEQFMTEHRTGNTVRRITTAAALKGLLPHVFS